METSTSDSTSKFSKAISTSLLISALGITSAALALFLYHLIVVRYCVRRQQAAAARSSPSVPNAPVVAGVDDKVLEIIPVLAYSPDKHDLFRVDQNECAVCLGELQDGDMVRLLPSCRHAFHVRCVDQWFLAHTNCPICRSPIVAQVAPAPALPSSVCSADQGDRDEIRPPIQDRENEMDGHRLLRNCASVVLPTERRPQRLITGLKRSLSVDQSFLVVEVQRRREIERACSSSSSPSSSSSSKVDISRTGSNRDRSAGHLDRVSSMLLGSFSRLRMGRSGAGNGNLLPY